MEKCFYSCDVFWAFYEMGTWFHGIDEIGNPIYQQLIHYGDDELHY
jgi:hypothetical protein